MRTTFIAITCLFFTPSCSYFESGLCSPDEKDAIFDAKLLGEWEAIEPRPGFIKVERDAPTSKAYRVTTLDPGAKGQKAPEPTPFKLHLIQLGDSYFLDAACPHNEERPQDGVAHFIFKMERRGPDIYIAMVSDEFVEKHKNELPQSVDERRFVKSVKVTASSQTVREFLRKYAADKMAWEQAFGYKRR